MKINKQSWYKNEWVVTLGSGLILLILPALLDVIRGKGFTDTITWLFNLEVRLGSVFIVVFLIITMGVIFKSYRKRRQTYEPLFIAGTRVIMKTDTKPIMITAEFDEITNEVWCSWSINSEIKRVKINQNLIKEYLSPVPLPIAAGRSSDYWRY